MLFSTVAATRGAGASLRYGVTVATASSSSSSSSSWLVLLGADKKLLIVCQGSEETALRCTPPFGRPKRTDVSAPRSRKRTFSIAPPSRAQKLLGCAYFIRRPLGPECPANHFPSAAARARRASNIDHVFLVSGVLPCRLADSRRFDHDGDDDVERRVRLFLVFSPPRCAAFEMNAIRPPGHLTRQGPARKV